MFGVCFPEAGMFPQKTIAVASEGLFGIAFPQTKNVAIPSQHPQRGAAKTSQVVRLYSNDASPENEECCKHISFSNHHFPGDVFVFKGVTAFFVKIFQSEFMSHPDQPVVGIPIFAYLIFGWLDFSG